MSEGLIEQIEQADGPSRELDLAICLAMNTGRKTDPRDPGPDPYTASIDAALTLVPEGFDLELQILEGRASVWRVDDHGECGCSCTLFAEDCATPALAICAASLRARQAIGDGVR